MMVLGHTTGAHVCVREEALCMNCGFMIQGRSPLWVAARDGHELCVALLIKEGADVHAKNNNVRAWAAPSVCVCVCVCGMCLATGGRAGRGARSRGELYWCARMMACGAEGRRGGRHAQIARRSTGQAGKHDIYTGGWTWRWTRRPRASDC